MIFEDIMKKGDERRGEKIHFEGEMMKNFKFQ